MYEGYIDWNCIVEMKLINVLFYVFKRFELEYVYPDCFSFDNKLMDILWHRNGVATCKLVYANMFMTLAAVLRFFAVEIGI